MAPSTIKSKLQKLHVVKNVTKSEKKSTKITTHYIQTTHPYSGFLVVKQPLALVLMSVVVRSYV
jgi:hypothetical protein